MCNQIFAFNSIWRVLHISKYYISSSSVRQRIHCPRRLRRLCIRVHSHLAEVVAEAWLHEGARGRIKRRSRRAKDIMDNRGHRIGSTLCARILHGRMLHETSLIWASIAFALQERARYGRIRFAGLCHFNGLQLYHQSKGLHEFCFYTIQERQLEGIIAQPSYALAI